MNKRISNRILRYVERSEGMRFKRNPTVGTTTKAGKVGGMNTAKVVQKDGKVMRVLSAKVYVAPKLLAEKRVAERRLTLLHELRENLYYQNTVKMTQKTAHRKALSHQKQDFKYSTRGLVKVT